MDVVDSVQTQLLCQYAKLKQVKEGGTNQVCSKSVYGELCCICRFMQQSREGAWSRSTARVRDGLQQRIELPVASLERSLSSDCMVRSLFSVVGQVLAFIMTWVWLVQ